MIFSKIDKKLAEQRRLFDVAQEKLKRDTLIERARRNLERDTYMQERFSRFPDLMARKRELHYGTENLNDANTLNQMREVNDSAFQAANEMYQLGRCLHVDPNLRPHDQWILPMDEIDTQYKRFISAEDGETVVTAPSEWTVVHPTDGESNVSDAITKLKWISSGPCFETLTGIEDTLPGGTVPLFLNAMKIARDLPLILDFCRSERTSHVFCATSLQYTRALEKFLYKRFPWGKSPLVTLTWYNQELGDLVASHTVAETERPEFYWGVDGPVED